ncbi:gamma-mobile-trio integrase GmtZ [Sulfuritalea hydrogenivorans]|nr:VPA1269 family protein [Sulfuritalea hydrogenivorans]
MALPYDMVQRLTPKIREAQIDEQIKKEAIRQVEQGESRKRVAAAMGISASVVGKWTKHIQTEKRPDERLTEIIMRRLEAGESKVSIAKAMGLTIGKVQYLTPKTRERSVDEDVREQAVRRVENGESKKAVASGIGVSVSTVNNWTQHVKKVEHIPRDTKEELMRRVRNGEKPTDVARELNLDTSYACYLASSVDADLTPEQYKRIMKAFQEGRKYVQIASDLGVPTRIVRSVIGHKTTKKQRYSDAVRLAAIRAVESGKTVQEVAVEFKASRAIVKKWFDAAVAGGLAKPPQVLKAKSEDKDFLWITRLDPELEEWRVFVAEWMNGEKTNLSGKISAITGFIERYLVARKLPKKPADLLLRSNIQQDFYATACSHQQAEHGIRINNCIHVFLRWVLRTPEFADTSSGEPITLPMFRNPVPELFASGVAKANTESDKVVLPYWMISDLRRRIALGPNFRDWCWVRCLQGKLSVDGSNEGPDWFEVEESHIDKNDPDCVWRLRQRVGQDPVLEMWSPVRWVAVLVQLQIPSRVGQIRMVDSGEADTFIWQGGKFIPNKGSLRTGTARNPRRQGVFRRPDPEDETMGATVAIFLNSNKTNDIGRRSGAKGMVCPWPRMNDLADDPYYWFAKLRDWQQKYNPISRLTAWRDLPARRALTVKAEEKSNEYPDTAFLFRTPETPTEAEWPLTSGMHKKAWRKLLAAYEEILQTEDVTHPDGSPIRLINERGQPASSPHATRVSLITHMILDGNVPPEMMMKIVGHSRFIMTIYYTKPGLKHIQDAVLGAVERLDAKKDENLTRDLAGLRMEQLRDRVVFNAADPATVLPVNPSDRNPLGWLYLHDGICLAGGNTGPVPDNASVPGCHNGGPVLKKAGNDVKKWTFGQTPGGVRNCARCRWKVAGTEHLKGLCATFNNRQYHLHKAGEQVAAGERARNDILKEKARTESSSQPFNRASDLRAAERMLEASAQKYNELTLDIVNLYRTIERINALPNNPDGPTALVAQGDLLTLQTVVEETDSELLVLAGMIADLEFYPDLEAGTAIFEFAQILDRAFEREREPMAFARMSEHEKMTAANGFMRALENHINPDNPILARRHVVEILDRQASIEKTLGIKLNNLLPQAGPSDNKPVYLRMVNTEVRNDDDMCCAS